MDPKARKNLAVMILEGAKKKAPESSPDLGAGEDDEEDEDTTGRAGMMSAMDDLIAAIHAKDSKAAVEAFLSLNEMC